MRGLMAFGFLVCALSAQAQLYRWTDDSGKVHYTDMPPPANAKNVQKKELARPVPTESSQQPYALQQALKKFPVTIYVSKDCGDPCKRGLAHLKKRGVPFAEKNVSKQDEIDELTKLAGAPRVPTLVVGVEVQKDYDLDVWDQALDTAGYPRSGTP